MLEPYYRMSNGSISEYHTVSIPPTELLLEDRASWYGVACQETCLNDGLLSVVIVPSGILSFSRQAVKD